MGLGKVYKLNLIVGTNEKVFCSEEDFDFSLFDEELSYVPLTVQLVEVDVDNDAEKVIGYFDGYYFDIDYINEHGASIFSVLDMISGDTCGAYDTLFDSDEMLKDEYSSICDNFFYLDRIYIEKEYRNRGYAKKLLKNMDKIISKMAKLEIGLIVTCCQNFEIENGEEKIIRNDKELKQKLISLYEKTGFEMADNYSDAIYMVKVVAPF